MKLSFHGGAREVTGACYLLETSKIEILIDCGLFQGCDECADLNFSDFKFDPHKIDALIVTHGHLDHVGRIPKLVRDGFHGKIYSTAATRELARLIIEDAFHLMQRGSHQLYDEKDLENSFKIWEDIPYHKSVNLGDVSFKLNEAGHILGSSLVELWIEGQHWLFTGDLGNIPSALLPPPETFRDIEYLVIESTYGNKEHEKHDERVLKLERAVEDVTARGGTLLIPAFATERTQDVLFYLNEVLLYKRIPEIPVFVDAPLAIRITDVFERYTDLYKEEIKELYKKHPNLFKFKKLKFTESVEESKKINDVPPPKVVIAGSGMMQGGRILHHAQRYLQDPSSILLIIGYQAAGSLGRRLIDGEKKIKLFGEDILVQAEIRKINGFSAHADNPQLFDFVDRNRDALKHVFVVQGEEAQALHFMTELRDRLGVAADAPELYQEFKI